MTKYNYLLQLRIPHELKAQIADIAKAEDRPESFVIRGALRDYIAAWRAPAPSRSTAGRGDDVDAAAEARA